MELKTFKGAIQSNTLIHILPTWLPSKFPYAKLVLGSLFFECKIQNPMSAQAQGSTSMSRINKLFGTNFAYDYWDYLEFERPK